jgi:hypothetical protein
MNNNFTARDLDRAVGCLRALIAVALIAIGAAVGLIVGYVMWGGA